MVRAVDILRSDLMEIPSLPVRRKFRFACVGTYVPRQCGIGTFSHDLCEAICDEAKDEDACHVIAMNDIPEGYEYPPRVRFEVRQGQLPDYQLAADFMNVRGMDVLLIQHEYGIFGGDCGTHLLALLGEARMPVVTTLHTVVRKPSEQMHKLTVELAAASDRVVVMANRAVDMLDEVYGIPRDKVVVIPHGIPDVPFVDPTFYKDQFGVEGRRVLLTFGLLSPGKGIEYVIRALPELVNDHPDLIYIVLGATHPHVKQLRGEEYRHQLQHLAEDLGVLDHIIFQNRYVTLEELCEFIGAADIYVTPYLGEEQIVSGTLAYALGAGKAVVSTKYAYAEEVLADGRGRLVPFQDHEAIASEVGWLLDHETERQVMRKKAYLYTRDFVWRQVALSYLELFRKVSSEPSQHRQPTQHELVETALPLHAVPELKLNHLNAMTDDVGILQHARYTVADRNFGYCTDDNGRALVVALRCFQLTNSPELLELAQIYISFLQHAYDARSGRFRNFMTYDRTWLDEIGSEDCHARALWGLGFGVALAPTEGMRAMALDLFGRTLDAVSTFSSPRSWAFTLVGVHAYLRKYGGDSDARRIRETLALRLFDLFQNNRADDWVWPEDVITYANGKLPHALLLAGQWMQRGDLVDMGLISLNWLLKIQVSPHGNLSPIGNHKWYRRGKKPSHFDQQPIEAHTLLEACLEAYNVTRDTRWVTEARRCFDWFLGRNDLGKPLYDYETGGCRDGLHSDGVNENEGAESTLAYLLSLLAIRSLGPAAVDPMTTDSVTVAS